MRLLRSLRRALRRPFVGVYLWAIQPKCIGRIDGVAVCDLVASDLPNSTFLRPTMKAMELIQKFDPRRYSRVCRQIRYIVNRPLISAGNYERDGRICNVDYNKHYASEQPEWRLRSYACLIVHEATHGLLMEKGVNYDNKTWQRVEELCSLEEYRFARKVDEWWADEYRSPKRFDPSWWKTHRSRGERRGAWLKRLAAQREELRKKKRERERERRLQRLRRQGKRLF